MKFKLGDKVKFEGEDYKGVGTIVAINNKELFLVYSQDITYGHDGMWREYLQDTDRNWWFIKDELELIEEDEE